MNQKLIKLLTIPLVLALLIFGQIMLTQTNQLVRANETNDTDEEEVNPNATEALKDRIEKVVEEKKLNNNLNDNQAQKTKRGFLGFVERVSEEAITFSTNKGNQIIPITNDVQLIKGGRNIEIKDIEIEESAIVLGYQEKDTFTPMKILISSRDLRPKPKLVVLGSVVSISANRLTMECRREAKEHQIVLNTATVYQDSEDEPITRTQLFEDMQVLAVGNIEIGQDNQTETKTAKLVRALVKLD